MEIKIIAGTYGFRPGGGHRVVPVSCGEACDVPDDEAARLVGLGVAAYVAPGAASTPAAVSEGDDQGNTSTDGESATAPSEDGTTIPDTLDIEDGHFTEASLSVMTKANLEKLAADLGLDTSGCQKKADYVALLASVDLDVAEIEEEAPEISGNAIVE